MRVYLLVPQQIRLVWDTAVVSALEGPAGEMAQNEEGLLRVLA
jgi:hypothetical protein